MLKISRLNTVLLALIIAVNAFTIIAPFAPNLWYWWQNHHTQRAAELNSQIHTQTAKPNSPSAKTKNTVIIPSMFLDRPILEGQDTYAVLNKGIWRWPGGSTPDRGSNTVLVGHRFTYTNPRGVFYFLNKVKVGDEIGIIWNSKTYLYKIMNTKVVPPSDTSILNATVQPTLTLYTCTPLWLPKDRLVVTAHLEKSS